METRDEPTIGLFCGDHLPRFGPEYAIYRESGSVTSPPGNYTLKEYFDMASVPCLIWANKPDLLDADFIPEQVSPVYFPAILLHQLGIDMPSHLKYLSRGIKEYPVIHRQFLWRSDGELTDFVTGKDSPFLRGMEMLQYDILFGEGYSLSKPQETY
jgi:hypothetical protein